jgi:hypothetical protein
MILEAYIAKKSLKHGEGFVLMEESFDGNISASKGIRTLPMNWEEEHQIIKNLNFITLGKLFKKIFSFVFVFFFTRRTTIFFNCQSLYNC